MILLPYKDFFKKYVTTINRYSSPRITLSENLILPKDTVIHFIAKNCHSFVRNSKQIQNIRSVRQQIRQSRVAQSSMLNVGAQTGGMGGSGMAGGMSSVGSQLGSNLDYMSQIATANTAIGGAAMDYSTAMGDASIASSKASQYAAVANLGGTVFGSVGGFGKTPSTPQRTG
jgi:hypothetical protein